MSQQPWLNSMEENGSQMIRVKLHQPQLKTGFRQGYTWSIVVIFAQKKQILIR